MSQCSPANPPPHLGGYDPETGAKGGELLRREILDEARRQEQEILRGAQEAADRFVAKAEQEAEQARRDKLEAARAEAKRRQESILATVSVETGRMRLARIEELLQCIHDQALDQLRKGDGFSRREAMAELAARALSFMTGNDFVMRLSSADLRVLGDGLAEEVRRRWTRPWLRLELCEDPEVKDGDWVLQDREGHQIWELGLEARLERLWPDLRRQIATQAGLVGKEESKGGRL